MPVRNLPIKHASLMLLAAAAIAASPASQAAEAAGMRVVRDPATGQLRGPTPEEFKDMQKQEAKTAAKTSAKTGVMHRLATPSDASAMPRLQNGNAVGYRVGDAFLSYSVAKRSTDGTLATHCVTGAEAADKLLKAPQSSTAKLDEEHGDAQ